MWKGRGAPSLGDDVVVVEGQQVLWHYKDAFVVGQVNKHLGDQTWLASALAYLVLSLAQL
jgi:hypothetical protein